MKSCLTRVLFTILLASTMSLEERICLVRRCLNRSVCWKVLVTNPVLWNGNPKYWMELRDKEQVWDYGENDDVGRCMTGFDWRWWCQAWWCRRTDSWTQYFCYEVQFIYIGSLGDARQQVVSSGKYRPGAGLKTIGERGDDASDDASNRKNMRVM